MTPDMGRFARQVAICESKVVFKTQGAALVYAAHRMNREATKGRPASSVERLWPYRCSICADWHLTSQPHAGMAAERAKAVPFEGGRRHA